MHRKHWHLWLTLVPVLAGIGFRVHGFFGRSLELATHIGNTLVSVLGSIHCLGPWPQFLWPVWCLSPQRRGGEQQYCDEVPNTTHSGWLLESEEHEVKVGEKE
jgi:hypothetical protein